MAHVRLSWTPERFGELDVVLVDVLVGLHRDGPLRDAGQLRLHASELNALDRLLQTGSEFHRPAHTYEIAAAEDLAAAANGRS